MTRFREREIEIHRLRARDPDFEEICEDYGVALAEFQRWTEAGPTGAVTAKDYRGVLDELEAEILGILDGPRGRGPRPNEEG